MISQKKKEKFPCCFPATKKSTCSSDTNIGISRKCSFEICLSILVKDGHLESALLPRPARHAASTCMMRCLSPQWATWIFKLVKVHGIPRRISSTVSSLAPAGCGATRRSFWSLIALSSAA